MTTKKELMYQRITKHGEELIRFFNLPVNTDPVKLCKSLFRLEKKCHHVVTCLCNTNTMHLLELNRYTGYDVHQSTDEEQDEFFDGIMRSLGKIIGKEAAEKCFINHDPRGYSLKIREEFSKVFYYKDWGGFGILAPDFQEQIEAIKNY